MSEAQVRRLAARLTEKQKRELLLLAAVLRETGPAEEAGGYERADDI